MTIMKIKETVVIPMNNPNFGKPAEGNLSTAHDWRKNVPVDDEKEASAQQRSQAQLPKTR